MNCEEILRAYQSAGGLRAASRQLNISETKVRKALITLGSYETVRTREIAALWAQGLRYAEIAETLGISKACVYANTPYEKGMYLSDNPTKNAIWIRRYKERKRIAKAQESKGE